MSTTNLFGYITQDQRFLIDTLNQMYNDNCREISRLTNSNEIIRNQIISLLNSTYRRNNNDRTYRSPSSNQRTFNTPYRSANINNRTSNRPPYILEEIAQYRIPLSSNFVRNVTQGNRQGLRETTINNTNRRTNLLNTTQGEISQLIQTFLQPIDIYPTQSQIENATRLVRYSNILRPNNTSCPISLEPFNDDDYVTVIRHCNHIFRTNELQSWFRSNCRCPVCRYDIREYNRNSGGLMLDNIDVSGNVFDNTNIERSNNSTSNSTSNAISNSNISNVRRTNSGLEFDISNNALYDAISNYATNYLTNFLLNGTDSITRENVNNLQQTLTTDTSGNQLLSEIATFVFSIPQRRRN